MAGRSRLDFVAGLGDNKIDTHTEENKAGIETRVSGGISFIIELLPKQPANSGQWR